MSHPRHHAQVQEDWSGEPALNKVIVPGVEAAVDSQERLFSLLEELVAAADAAEEIDRRAQAAAAQAAAAAAAAAQQAAAAAAQAAVAKAAAAAPAEAKAVLLSTNGIDTGAGASPVSDDQEALERWAASMWSLAQVVAMTTPKMG